MSYTYNGHFYMTKNDVFKAYIKEVEKREKGCNNLKKVFGDMLDESENFQLQNKVSINERISAKVIEKLVNLVNRVLSKDAVLNNYEKLITTGDSGKIIFLKNKENFEKFLNYERKQIECYSDLIDVFDLVGELSSKGLLDYKKNMIELLEKSIKSADSILERDRIVANNIKKDYLIQEEKEQ